MIRETSVHLIENICRGISENPPGEQYRHSVRQIECQPESRIVLPVSEQKLQIVLADINFPHLSPVFCRYALPAFVYPLLYLAESVVEAYRKSIFHGHLHAVVRGRIVRSRNLHRCLESVLGSTEINHRSSTQTEITDIRSGIRNALYKIFMNLRRRNAAVPSDQNLVGLQKFRQEKSCPVNRILVEIDIVDTSDVVSMKCTHSQSSFVLYLAETFPLEILRSFFAIIFFLIGATLSTKILPSR